MYRYITYDNIAVITSVIYKKKNEQYFEVLSNSKLVGVSNQHCDVYFMPNYIDSYYQYYSIYVF